MATEALTIETLNTPQHFIETYKVSPEQAADLAQQANSAGRRGVGLAAPPAAPLAPSAPAPGAAVLSARAEYDQLMADRASGKITNGTWNAKGAARERALAELIAGGAGNAPAPSTQPADPMAEVFASPPSASDYRLPHYEGTPTDEDIAADRTFKEAMFAAQLPRSAVESILANVLSTSRAIEAAPESERARLVQARLDSNKVRMTEMWAKEGTDWDTAVHTIDLEVARWPELLQEELRKAGPFLGPLDWDQLLQLAKFRNRTRA